MGFRMIVTVKQVPDTHNITENTMKKDGTVNRAALPAIFNPEDLNALEEALKIKETSGGIITVISMGPPKAEEILKECLFRGADDVILVSDRKFAGADTLATSYALSCAIKKIGEYDIIFCGRQAIDGDTAQVGPQLAEKLDINQITCVREIIELTDSFVIAKRAIKRGYEIVKSKLPVLITITGDANEPRFPNVKRVMMYKKIERKLEQKPDRKLPAKTFQNNMLEYIKEWNISSIQADPLKCGLSGSPTKVKKVQNVVLTTTNRKKISDTDAGVCELINGLIKEHIIA